MPMQMSFNLPADLQKSLVQASKDWQDSGNTRKLWSKDQSLWNMQDDAINEGHHDAEDHLAWLDSLDRQQQDLPQLRDLQGDVRSASFESVVLLGMGGEALCAQVIAQAFGRLSGFPAIYFLDTVDPEPIKRLRESLDLAKTLFLVSSKSGNTLETNPLKSWFFDQMKTAVGNEAGSHFLAITDPDSRLQQSAQEDNFKRVFLSEPSITGPYTALCNFGMVPAAVLGLDLPRWLEQASQASKACQSDDTVENPGIHLGLLLGAAALQKRDKLTLISSSQPNGLGAWIEQLLATSTGKDAKGIIPICGEHIAPPSHYGKDRLFVCMQLAGEENADLERQLAKLQQAGHPLLRLRLDSPYDLAQQFFIWQVAAFVAAAVLSVRPFDQPDIEAASIETRMRLDDFQETGKLKSAEPIYAEGGDHGALLYASRKYAARLRKAAGSKPRLEQLLKAHLDQIRTGDYFAVLAYLPDTEQNQQAIQYFRHQVRGAKKTATCLGFGAAALHATGQLFKGGPNTGVFLQITADQNADVPIPSSKYSFGILSDALAAGDLEVLEQRGRRIVRVHLSSDIKTGLRRLSETIESALNDS
jgi:glucose-6-phosphate isomerase